MPTTDPTSAAETLRLVRVTHRIGGVTAVDDLSLGVRDGEFLTLLGPSGCGKSTTLRIIAGYSRPQHGEVHLRGRDVTNLSPQRREIGMVFQNYALFPHLNVARNVGFALTVRRRDRAQIARRVDEMLRLVQLEGFGERMPSQLSGGQQQRIALARVLAFGPELLLLDEPLSALDLKLREDMQGEIKRIQRALGITTVYVTHDQGEALHLSDRIAVMRAGRIEQVGTPDVIYRHPATRFVASFLGKMQFLQATVIGHESNESGRHVVRLHGHDVCFACSAPQPLAVGQRCIAGIRPEKVRISEADSHATRPWSIAGQIQERHYLGAHAQLAVVTAFGAPLIALDHDDRLQAGRQVQVSWDEADVTVFPDDSPEEAGVPHPAPAAQQDASVFESASRTPTLEAE